MTLLKELCPVLLGGGKKFWDVLSTFQIGTFTFFCSRNSFVIVSWEHFSCARFWVQVHRKKNPIFSKACRNTAKSLMYGHLAMIFTSHYEVLKRICKKLKYTTMAFLGKRLDRPKTLQDNSI